MVDIRNVGGSGLRISNLGFGAMTFGGEGTAYARMGTTDGADAERMVNKCLDAGITFFDTANTYADGRSEEVLGAALGRKRQDVVLATKGYNRIGPGPNDIGASRTYIIRACEESLRRLGTDYIDLYQLHNYDGLTPQEETLRALDDLIQAGKIRYVGVSNYSGWHLMKALGISDRLGIARYTSHQVNYSLLNRDVENEIVPLAVEEKVGLIAWSPLQSGLLSGKYRRDAPEPDRARLAGRTPAGQEGERLFTIVDVMAGIARDRGVTPSQVALNWVMQRPAMCCVLIGARDEAQLDENLGAAGWTLSEDEIARLDAASERPWIYPYSAHSQYAGARNPYFLRGRGFTPLVSGPWDAESRD